MKKHLKLFAMAFVAMSLAFAACDPTEENGNGNGNGGNGENGGNSGSATITYVDHESSPIVVNPFDEKELDIFGQHEFMFENYGSEEEAMLAILTPGAGLVTVADDYHDNLVPMQQDAVIGNSCHWTICTGEALFSTIYENSTYGVYTEWNNKTAYVGFCAKQNGETHYGWIKMKVTVSNNSPVFTIYGYAYETTPNQSIKAGQK